MSEQYEVRVFEFEDEEPATLIERKVFKTPYEAKMFTDCYNEEADYLNSDSYRTYAEYVGKVS